MNYKKILLAMLLVPAFYTQAKCQDNNQECTQENKHNKQNKRSKKNKCGKRYSGRCSSGRCS
ncbi:hypothetical protein [Candidatus Babela massiliensis]|uniref:Uncharacterized protein n=1 Tax=Candidatus Babela massiliensis TaxID=673862 RepID=V6DG72_9BACT|nr:hypothetical protein [Candidatus Babela massiliensis]CDK30597.1 hypothetical protein BABL1_gene_419 [Candidatus Babela massiliensis]